jgi:mono/diheme cytochrome c family protein
VACLRGEGILRIDHANGKLGAMEWLFRKQFGRIRSLTESTEGYLYLTTSQFDPDEGQPRPSYDLILRVVPARARRSVYPELTPSIAPAEDRVAEETASILQGLSSKGACGDCHTPAQATAGAQAALELIGRNCAPCHGIALLGGSTAPGLLEGHWKYASDDMSLKTAITQGLMDRGMPASPHSSRKKSPPSCTICVS